MVVSKGHGHGATGDLPNFNVSELPYPTIPYHKTSYGHISPAIVTVPDSNLYRCSTCPSPIVDTTKPSSSCV